MPKRRVPGNAGPRAANSQGRARQIRHANESFVILRRSYVRICGGNCVAAALLSICEFIADNRLEHGEGEWFQRTNERFVKEALGLASEKTVRAALKELERRGFVSVKRANGDPRGTYYRFNAAFVQATLDGATSAKRAQVEEQLDESTPANSAQVDTPTTPAETVQLAGNNGTGPVPELPSTRADTAGPPGENGTGSHLSYTRAGEPSHEPFQEPNQEQKQKHEPPTATPGPRFPSAAASTSVFRSIQPDEENTPVETEALFAQIRRYYPGVARHGSWESKALEVPASDLPLITGLIPAVMPTTRRKNHNPLFLVTDAIGTLANIRAKPSDFLDSFHSFERELAEGLASRTIDVTAEATSNAIPPEPVYRNQVIKSKNKCAGDCSCGSELFVTADGPDDGPVILCARCDLDKLIPSIIKKCNVLEEQRRAGMSWDEIRAAARREGDERPDCHGTSFAHLMAAGAGPILPTFDADRSR